MKPRRAQEDHTHGDPGGGATSILPVDEGFGSHTWWHAGVNSHSNRGVTLSEAGTMTYNAPPNSSAYGGGTAPLNARTFRKATYSSGGMTGFYATADDVYLNKSTGFRTRFWFDASYAQKGFVGLWAGGSSFTFSSYTSITPQYFGMYWDRAAGTLRPAWRGSSSAIRDSAIMDTSFSEVLYQLQIDVVTNSSTVNWRLLISDGTAEQSGTFGITLPSTQNFGPLVIAGDTTGEAVAFHSFDAITPWFTESFPV